MVAIETETLRRLADCPRAHTPTRLEIGDGWLRVLPHERDRFVRADVEGALGAELGEYEVDFATLRRFLLSVSAGTTQLGIEGGRLTAKAEGSNLSIPLRAATSIANVATDVTVAEFVIEVPLPFEVLAQAAELLPYVSTDETRPTLCNVSVESDGADLVCVATDTHKCGAIRFAGLGQSEKALLPADALRRFGKLFNGEEGGLRLQFTASQTWGCLRGERGLSFGWRPCEGAFPDWRKVIPEGAAGTTVQMPVAKALAALRTALAADDGSHRVTISKEDVLGGSATFVHNGHECQSGTEWAGVVWVGPQETVDLNGVYLGQIIRAHRALGAKEVRLLVNGPLEPVRVESVEPPKVPATDFRSVVMPMQK